MSMSTHVVGFKPPDDKWKKMKAVWDACKAAGIDPPDDVDAFFEGTAPDDQGMEVDLDGHECAVKYRPASRARDGIEVDVKKLPPDVTVIRFYNSY